MAAARERIYEALGFGRWARSRVEELSGGTPAKLNLGVMGANVSLAEPADGKLSAA